MVQLGAAVASGLRVQCNKLQFASVYIKCQMKYAKGDCFVVLISLSLFIIV